MLIGQLIIIVVVLLMPLLVHRVERNLEVFLFVMGAASATISHLLGPSPVWSIHLVGEAFREPVLISAAVLAAGCIFQRYRVPITAAIVHGEKRLGPHVFAFLIVVILGLISSIITAIIAAIVLVEVIYALDLDRDYETKLTILSCFSIGLGAALTPAGEPLSTIAIGKLRGAPYHADFFFLLRNLGWYIIPGVVFLGFLGAFFRARQVASDSLGKPGARREETYRDVALRALKVYLFIMALVFLGAGFKPIIDTYLVRIHAGILYWINTISAVLDNATLASAEISSTMTLEQIRFLLMGLLISGGMLIPGNIPNIITAGKLNIRSKEWARFGVPLGSILMVVYFVILLIFSMPHPR